MKMLAIALGITLASPTFVSSNPRPFGYEAIMTASEVVPPSGSTGSAKFYIFWAEADTVGAAEAFIEYSGLSDSVTSATICRGAIGENGPVAYTPFPHFFLPGERALVEDWNHADFQEAESGRLYVLIHTRAYPDGELRGQLAPYFSPVRRESWGKIRGFYR